MGREATDEFRDSRLSSMSSGECGVRRGLRSGPRNLGREREGSAAALPHDRCVPASEGSQPSLVAWIACVASEGHFGAVRQVVLRQPSHDGRSLLSVAKAFANRTRVDFGTSIVPRFSIM